MAEIIQNPSTNIVTIIRSGEALASQIANLAVLDTWVVVLLVWAGISVVLAIGFVLIVPIAAARDLEKRSRRDATTSDRTPPH